MPRVHAALVPLLEMIDQAYNRRSWHGTNLRGALRGMRATTAAWRPAPGRHNIWELTLHAAYWKYTVTRRLTGAARGSFPLKGSNFFPRPVGRARDEDWQADVALLDATHRTLRLAISGLSRAALSRPAPGGTVTTQALVMGIAAHDLYHAGQIQLLKRLQR